MAAGGHRCAFARNPIGYGMGAPTIADPRQRGAGAASYLRPLFTGEEIWCQLFSEPGAGSDVASLATRAVRDGDEWIVNGQKVWTTLAHLSQWGMLVARTDPEQPKHKGLTYFVVDMHAPGRRGAGRCARSPARPSSTRCSSPTSASPTASASATSATAGGCRSPRS